jgi:hypothetical protein
VKGVRTELNRNDSFASACVLFQNRVIKKNLQGTHELVLLPEEFGALWGKGTRCGEKTGMPMDRPEIYLWTPTTLGDRGFDDEL